MPWHCAFCRWTLSYINFIVCLQQSIHTFNQIDCFSSNISHFFYFTRLFDFNSVCSCRIAFFVLRYQLDCALDILCGRLTDSISWQADNYIGIYISLHGNDFHPEWLFCVSNERRTNRNQSKTFHVDFIWIHCSWLDVTRARRTYMKMQSINNGNLLEIIDLAHSLRQEHLFIANEQAAFNRLNETLSRNSSSVAQVWNSIVCLLCICLAWT